MKKLLKGLCVGASAFLLTYAGAAAFTSPYPTSYTSWTTGNTITSAWLNAIEQMIGTGSTSTSLTQQIANVSSSVFPSSTWLKVSNSLSDLTSTSSARVNIGLGNLANALQLIAANNLSDLTSTSSARVNIGLNNLSNALQLVAANNLSDLTNTSTARSNLGYSSGTNINVNNGTGVIGITGQVGVANGGTGTSTASTDGQYLGSNGAVPTWKSFTAGNNITITTSTTSTILSAIAVSNGNPVTTGATPTSTNSITIDATSTASSTATTNLSWSHTNTSTAPVTLIVFSNSQNAISAATYNGVPFLSISSSSLQAQTAFEYVGCLQNAATGTHSISLQQASGNITAFAISVIGANGCTTEVTSTAVATTGGSFAVNGTTTYQNDLVLGMILSNQNAQPTAGGSSTALQAYAGGTGLNSAIYLKYSPSTAATGSVQLNANGTSGFWAGIMYPIAPTPALSITGTNFAGQFSSPQARTSTILNFVSSTFVNGESCGINSPTVTTTYRMSYYGISSIQMIWDSVIPTSTNFSYWCLGY